MSDSVTIHVDMKDLPKAFRNFQDQIPFAGSRALNSTAFDKRKDMQNGELRKYLTLRNRHTERGIKVRMSTKYNLEVTYGSVDWYFERQVMGDRNTPRIGIKYKGRRYLFTPKEEMRTRTGRLKKLSLAGRKAFVIKTKKGDVLLVRQKRRNRRHGLEVLGFLTVHQDFKARVPWEKISLENVDALFRRHFRRSMVKAIRTSR